MFIRIIVIVDFGGTIDDHPRLGTGSLHSVGHHRGDDEEHGVVLAHEEFVDLAAGGGAFAAAGEEKIRGRRQHAAVADVELLELPLLLTRLGVERQDGDGASGGAVNGEVN